MKDQVTVPEPEPFRRPRVLPFSRDVHEIIAFVPGFMGFDHLGGLSYFADNVIAAVRAAREAELDRRVPVMGLTTLPGSSLVDRQAFLFGQLDEQIQRLRPKRIHLVGHSTGGVDAYFATCRLSMDGQPWTHAQREVRARLASVTTLASPLLGTTLAATRAARFIARPHGVAPVRELLAAGLGVGLLVAQNRGTPARVAAVLEGLPSALGLLHQLLRHRELIEDLVPTLMLRRCEENRPDLEVQRSYFATLVQRSPTQYSSSLFRQLHDATASLAPAAPGDHLDANTALLHAAPRISSGKQSLLTLDAASNDGLCNTLRQVPPGARQSEIGGLVLGDHLDVMGYFDRVDARTGRERHTSIFRSGAGFRDDQFFELFGSLTARLN